MRHPIFRAALASAYIGCVVLVIHGLSILADDGGNDGFLIIPVAMLSLFVLSAAVMGYLFLSEPVMLFMDNRRKEAIAFFLKTVAAFAVFAALAVLGVILIAH